MRKILLTLTLIRYASIFAVCRINNFVVITIVGIVMPVNYHTATHLSR